MAAMCLRRLELTKCRGRNGFRNRTTPVKANQPVAAFRIKPAVDADILITNRIAGTIHTINALHFRNAFEIGIAIVRPVLAIDAILIENAVFIHKTLAINAGMIGERAVLTGFASDIGCTLAIQTKAVATIDIEKAFWFPQLDIMRFI